MLFVFSWPATTRPPGALRRQTESHVQALHSRLDAHRTCSEKPRRTERARRVRGHRGRKLDAMLRTRHPPWISKCAFSGRISPFHIGLHFTPPADFDLLPRKLRIAQPATVGLARRIRMSTGGYGRCRANDVTLPQHLQHSPPTVMMCTQCDHK
jgi:hypothetical protein